MDKYDLNKNRNEDKFIDTYGGKKCPKPECGGMLMISWYKNTQTVRCNLCLSEFYEKDGKLEEINKEKEN